MASVGQSASSRELVPLNLNDYQRLAKLKLPRALYEYLASGTGDEQTLSENKAAFKLWYLRPRVMRPISNLSTRTHLFGQPLSMPVFVSPAGVHALCDKDGECASARACGVVGTMFGLSQHATRTIEQVAHAAPVTNRWYQAYILKDRQLTVRLIQRALSCGYKGIFLTVDSVRFGYREADARNGFDALPAPHRLVNYDEYVSMEKTYNAAKADAWDQNTEQMFLQDARWEDVTWLKAAACPHVPLVIKGIMTGNDAILAVNAGADGVMVSNHGGRQLDGALASVDVLPEVVAAVDGMVPVLLDSGVRRGTDVVKALALGATAVGVGKPVFFALSVGGEQAVVEMLMMMKREIEAAMAICGCRTVQDIVSSLVTRRPNRSALVSQIRSAL